MEVPSPRLAALGRIVDRAGKLAQGARHHLVCELKPDGSIVTNADRDVETMLRHELASFVPGTGIWGEEFGMEPEGTGGLWAVDPVDGTSNFAFGGPLWGVSVALLHGPHIVLGAVSLPDLNETFLAEKGAGGFLNGAALPPIPPGGIVDHELVSYSDSLLRAFPGGSIPGNMRRNGALVIEGTFTACQRLRGMIGHKEKLYDMAACALLGLELGADVRYADGSALEWEPLKQDSPLPKPWIIFPRDSGFYLSKET